MIRLNDAARILRVVRRMGKRAAPQPLLHLGTVISVEPFRLAIDHVDCEFLSDDVLFSAHMLPLVCTASINGALSMSGSATFRGNSGTLTINNQNIELNATVSVGQVLSDGDRVATMAIGTNKLLILCKVVSAE